MKTNLRLIGLMTAMMAFLPSAALTQDTDTDGIEDSVESKLLSALAPIWYSPEPGHRGPLPLDWAVRHCRLHWYASRARDAASIGNTGADPLSINLALDFIDAHRRNGLKYHYRLAFKDGGYREGIDPADPMSWEIAVSRGVGVYGRVSPLTGPAKHYSVQFFAYFGWNETDTPPGCDAGNHEGDWVCIDLHVEASDLDHPRIYDAVFHNHGRQIFIESPAALKFEGTHLAVYPERGTQELWPFLGSQGFLQGTVPPSVSVNRIFGQWENDATAPGGYSVVRQHEGTGGRYFIASVENVGERGQPYPSAAARFFQNFDGWYGNEWAEDCYWGVLEIPTDPPPGPAFQGAMWDRNFPGGRVWQTWKGQLSVVVDFVNGGAQEGSARQPFNRLGNALPATARNGTITIRAGNSPERLTVFEPSTITVDGGIVTIGQ